MRLSLVGVAIVCTGMALMRNNIYELVSESSAMSLVSLFVPLIAGLYWKKANSSGAIASMVAGTVVWLAALWLLPNHEGQTPPEHPGLTDTLLYMSPTLYGFLASALAMWIGSMFFKEKVGTPELS
jgi:SSS family solute:Na+ symporter